MWSLLFVVWVMCVIFNLAVIGAWCFATPMVLCLNWYSITADEMLRCAPASEWMVVGKLGMLCLMLSAVISALWWALGLAPLLWWSYQTRVWYLYKKEYHRI